MTITREAQERTCSKAETNASGNQLDFREKLKTFFESSPLPIDSLMTHFGLFTRGSALVKYLVLNDLYQRILNLPGQIMEFGTQWGQNMVLFENLRAIYEPFNKTRSIIGFDTFKGYSNISEKDKPGSAVFEEGLYATQHDYKKFLEELLAIHEGNNVLGHIRGMHKIVEGDVVETVPAYFKNYPETVVALAYFDMGLYKPTKIALEAIKPHLIPGSVILLDEFTWSEAPGEAIAFKEVFSRDRYKIEKSQYTPMRAIITII